MNFKVFIGQIAEGTGSPCHAMKDVTTTSGTDTITMVELNNGNKVPYMEDASRSASRPDSNPPLRKSWNASIL